MLPDSDDPEEDFYKWLMANFGEYAEKFGRYGAFGLVGVNLKGSLEIGITDLPTSWMDVLGAPGSVIGDLWEGGVNIAKGDISKGVERLLPLALSGPLKGYREATEGLTTRTNKPIFFGPDRVKADLTDAILRGLSFNPANIARIREIKWAERKREEKYRAMRNDIYRRLSRFWLRPKVKRLKADYLNLLNDVREYNALVKMQGLRGIVPFITKKSIRRNLRQYFKASKKELLRRRVANQ
ncbi:MAG: hypothetical protein JRI80_04845 [Deltaproteobacteria bacterium]|nr:hypothetical protein [Deltaproteobacteria bacterium]